VKTHKDLDVWKRGMSLVEQIYKATARFPKEEMYGLTSQLRKAAVSFPSNIAEGAARSSVREYIQFLYVALGSLSEIETQVMITGKLGYLPVDDMLEEVESLRKMTIKLIKYLKSKK
jgi:four helix bundle protein